jgi:hypothetical protein
MGGYASDMLHVFYVHDLELLTVCLATRTGASNRLSKTGTTSGVTVVCLLEEDIVAPWSIVVLRVYTT